MSSNNTLVPQIKSLVLSPLQKGMLFQAQTAKHEDVYHNQVRVWFKEEVQVENFHRALDIIAKHYPILQSSINLSSLTQEFSEKEKLFFIEEDLSNFLDEEKNKKVNKIFKSELKTPFKINKPPLIRFRLVKLSKEEYLICITYHHILFAGTCVLKMVMDFFKIYDLLCDKKAVNLNSLCINGDLIKKINSDHVEEARNYINKLLVDFDSLAELSKPTVNRNYSSSHEIKTFAFDSLLISAIKRYCKTNKINLSIFFEFAWMLLIHYYSNAKDITIGITREISQNLIKNNIGFHVNTIPVLLKIENTTSILDCLIKLKAQHKYFNEAVHIPLYDIEASKKFRNEVGVFESIFDYKAISPNEYIKRNYKNWKTRSLDYIYITHHPIVLELQGDNQGVNGRIIYSEDLFENQYITEIINFYTNIIRQLAKENSECQIFDFCNILNKYKKDVMSCDASKEPMQAKEKRHIIKEFKKQALKFPNKVAIWDNFKSKTFSEIDTESDYLAGFLKKKHKLEAQQRVVVCFEKTSLYVSLLLSLFKLRAVFIPVSKDTPIGVIENIILDSEAHYFITDHKVMFSTLSSLGIKQILIDSENYKYNEDFCLNNIAPQSSDLAYIIYTSGTTGKPKGVQIKQYSLVNLLHSIKKVINFNETDTLLSVTDISFDIVYLEIFLPIITGSACIIATNEQKKSPELMNKLINHYHPTFMQATPTYWSSIIDNISKIKNIISGGEVLTINLAKKLEEASDNLWNFYGPTEATIWSVGYKISKEDLLQKAIPLGYPIDNTEIYILAEESNIATPNEVGEICIAGDGLSCGYTHKDYNFNAFIKLQVKGNSILVYATGDYGFLTEQGKLYFLGRKGDIIKIQGNRVELNEVESELVNYPAIEQAAVKTYEKNARTYLVAYYKSQRPINSHEIYNYLSKKLNAYKIPNLFVYLKEFPINSNGKIDKQKLAKPTSEIDDLTPVHKTIEINLIEKIWKEVLKIDEQCISVESNFFELGGNSIHAVQIIAKINELFDINLSVRELFNSPTIIQLSTKVINLTKRKMSLGLAPIRIVNDDQYPLAYQQKRLWVLNSIFDESALYNMSVALEFSGDLNTKCLELALLDLVDKHGILRTVYKDKNGIPYQIIQEDYYFKVEKESVRALSYKAIHQIVRQFAQKCFDLKNDLPIKAKILLKNPKTNYLLLNIHHIACDGWSTKILIKDLIKFYSNHLKGHYDTVFHNIIDYKDYAVWQNLLFEDECYNYFFEDWNKRLQGISTLNFQNKNNLGKRDSENFQGRRLKFSINESTYKIIKKISMQNQVTPFMILVTVFSIMLFRITRQESFLIGFPSSGRHIAEIEHIVGFFVNLLPIRFDCLAEKGFLELLLETRKNILHALSYQDIPFEKISKKIEKLNKTDSALMNVICIMQDNYSNEFSLGDVSVKRVFSEDDTLLMADYESAKVDLSLYMQEANNKLIGLFEYKTSIFKESTIKQYISYFQAMLDDIGSNYNQSIGSIKMLANRSSFLISPRAVSSPAKKYTNVVEWFEDCAIQNANYNALTYMNHSILYEELSKKVNKMANYLRTYCLKNNQPVLVYLKPSIDLVVSILSVLKSGCPYVPVDHTFPEKRIDYIFHDSEAQLIVSETSLLDNIDKKTDFFEKSLDIVKYHDAIDAQRDLFNFNNKTCSEVAYIIYTSGSTGKPKGVVVNHSQLIHLFHSIAQVYSWSAHEKWLLFHSIAFDFSVWEIWGALLNGGELIILPERLQYSSEKLIDFLFQNKVTIFNTTSSYMQTLMLYLKDNEEKLTSNKLKYIIFGGESIINFNLPKWFQLKFSENIKLFNMYGITEGTIHSTYYEIKKDNAEYIYTENLIGKALPNSQLFVLDEQKNVVPDGIVGNLYLAGEGVAAGYLNNAKLTSEKFSTIVNANGDSLRLFKTGDLVRMKEDGNLQYIGREDDQVSLRGYRIELSEIKRVILQSDYVDDAAVITHTTEKFEELLAFTVLNDKYFQKIESDIEKERVQHWESVFNEMYKNDANIEIDTFNITGWNDSYTGSQINADQMAEWVGCTVSKIIELHPKNVLEIGCGTGLILFRVIDTISSYVGIDFSKKALDYLSKTLNLHKVKKSVILQQKSALEANQINSKHDVIILNSLIQYFPSAYYLTDVLNSAINCAKPDGYVFLGDVREKGLADLFYISQLISSCKNDFVLSDFYEKRESEEELVVSLDFLYRYAKQHPRINYMRVELKHGNYFNEMNAFRYDIVFGVEKNFINHHPINWIFWKTTNLDQIEKEISENEFSYLALSNIPNKNIWQYAKKLEALEFSDQEISNNEVENLNFLFPSQLVNLSKKYNRKLYLLPSKYNHEKFFDVIIFNSTHQHIIESSFLIMPEDKQLEALNADLHAENLFNKPMENQYKHIVLQNIKEYVKANLPEYMCPSNWKVIKKIPLTYNNKIDKQTLLKKAETKMRFNITPLSSNEKIVAPIWEAVLNVPIRSSEDDFFILGGNSLLAIQMIDKIQNQLGIKIEIKELFDSSNISSFSEVVKEKLIEQEVAGLNLNYIRNQRDPLVLLKKSNEKTPLFLFHPVGGTVFVYLDLAHHLNIERPIYAFQDPGLESDILTFKSIPEMVQYYIQYIRKVQPTGPYLLGGSSMGGTLAYEAAYQLSLLGEKTSLVAMFDAWALHSKDIHNRQRLEAGMLRQYDLLKQRLRNAKLINPTIYLDLNYQRLQLILDYIPPETEQNIELYKCETVRSDLKQIDNLTNFWDNFTSGVVNTYVVPGDHESMMISPYVHQMSQLLRDKLKVLP